MHSKPLSFFLFFFLSFPLSCAFTAGESLVSKLGLSSPSSELSRSHLTVPFLLSSKKNIHMHNLQGNRYFTSHLLLSHHCSIFTPKTHLKVKRKLESPLGWGLGCLSGSFMSQRSARLIFHLFSSLSRFWLWGEGLRVDKLSVLLLGCDSVPMWNLVSQPNLNPI